MPNIVATSDFKGEIVIANKSDLAISEAITWFIGKYEPKYLRLLLGTDFAALFVAGLYPPITDPVTPVDARMTALLTPNGYDLKTAIASYIYYWYMRDKDLLTAGIGTVKPQAENAQIASAAEKVKRAWFEMVHIGYQALKYLNDNAVTYPEFNVPKWYSNFNLSWITFEYSTDIFYSDYFFSFYRTYRIPDIFIPINTMGL